MASMSETPRITLRQEDIDAMHAELPVAEVRILVAEQDWEPFMAVAYEGMEIPVHVEGYPVLRWTAVLVGACHHDKSILVVI
jgi:hypothetical protein